MSNKLTLRDTQKISLEILIDVHNFCLENNINYSLAYGTLIGAARHKGFIPWDDDIDIIMTRPNYNKFCEIYKSEKCRLIAPGKNSYISFARVCDIKKTKYVTMSPWTTEKNVGVWIDIFPIDAVSDIKEEFTKQIYELLPLLNKQVDIRQTLYIPSIHFPILTNLSLLFRKFKRKRDSINAINQSIKNIVNRFNYGDTNHCSQLVCRGNKDKEFFPIKLFESYTFMEFEGYQLMVASGWKEILTLNFGNYMKMPPASERKPHGGFVIYLWK